MNRITSQTTMVAYGCLYSRKLLRGESRQDTKAAVELRAALTYNGLEEIETRIDLLTAMYRKRQELETIIQKFHKSPLPPPGQAYGVILISDLLTFGTTTDELINNYRMLLDSRIGVYVLDSPNTLPQHKLFSTVENGTSIFISDSDIQKLFEKLPSVNLTPRCGRQKKGLDFPKYFIPIYWLYETYFITEKYALENEYTGKMTQWKFHQLCDRYEAMVRYQDDWNSWKSIPFIQVDLTTLPKRHGQIPSYMPELIQTVEKLRIESDTPANSPIISDLLTQASEKLGTPFLHPDVYQRFKRKLETGKSGMYHAAELINQSHSHSVIKKLQERALDYFPPIEND